MRSSNTFSPISLCRINPSSKLKHVLSWHYGENDCLNLWHTYSEMTEQKIE